MARPALVVVLCLFVFIFFVALLCIRCTTLLALQPQLVVAGEARFTLVVREKADENNDSPSRRRTLGELIDMDGRNNDLW